MTTATNAADSKDTKKAEDSGGRVGSPDPRTTAPFSANGAQPSHEDGHPQPTQDVRTGYSTLNAAPGSFAESFSKDPDDDTDDEEEDGKIPHRGIGTPAGSGTGGTGGALGGNPPLPGNQESGTFQTDDSSPKSDNDVGVSDNDMGVSDNEEPNGQEIPGAESGTDDAGAEEPETESETLADTEDASSDGQFELPETSDSYLTDRARKEREKAEREMRSRIIVSALAGGIADAATSIPKGLLRLVRATASGRPAAVADALVTGMADSVSSATREAARAAGSYAVPDRSGNRVTTVAGKTLETKKGAGVRQGNTHATELISKYIEDRFGADAVADGDDPLENLGPDDVMKLRDDFGRLYREGREKILKQMPEGDDRNAVVSGFNDTFTRVDRSLANLDRIARKDRGERDRAEARQEKERQRLEERRTALADRGLTLSDRDERARDIEASPLYEALYTTNGKDIVRIDADGVIPKDPRNYKVVEDNLRTMAGRMENGLYDADTMRAIAGGLGLDDATEARNVLVRTADRLNNMRISNTPAGANRVRNQILRQARQAQNAALSDAAVEQRIRDKGYIPLSREEYDGLRGWDRLAASTYLGRPVRIDMDDDFGVPRRMEDLRLYLENMLSLMYQVTKMSAKDPDDLTPEDMALLDEFGHPGDPGGLLDELWTDTKQGKDLMDSLSLKGVNELRRQEEAEERHAQLVSDWKSLPDPVAWLFGYDDEHVSDKLTSSRVNIGKALDVMERSNGMPFTPAMSATDAAYVAKKYRAIMADLNRGWISGNIPEDEYRSAIDEMNRYVKANNDYLSVVLGKTPVSDPDGFLNQIAGNAVNKAQDPRGLPVKQEGLTVYSNQARSLADMYDALSMSGDADAAERRDRFILIADALECYGDMREASRYIAHNSISPDAAFNKALMDIGSVMDNMGFVVRGKMDDSSFEERWNLDKMQDMMSKTESVIDWIEANSNVAPYDKVLQFTKSFGSSEHGFENGIEGLGHGRSPPATSESFFKEDYDDDDIEIDWGDTAGDQFQSEQKEDGRSDDVRTGGVEPAQNQAPRSPDAGVPGTGTGAQSAEPPKETTSMERLLERHRERRRREEEQRQQNPGGAEDDLFGWLDEIDSVGTPSPSKPPNETAATEKRGTPESEGVDLKKVIPSANPRELATLLRGVNDRTGVSRARLSPGLRANGAIANDILGDNWKDLAKKQEEAQSSIRTLTRQNKDYAFSLDKRRIKKNADDRYVAPDDVSRDVLDIITAYNGNLEKLEAHQEERDAALKDMAKMSEALHWAMHDEYMEQWNGRREGEGLNAETVARRYSRYLKDGVPARKATPRRKIAPRKEVEPRVADAPDGEVEEASPVESKTKPTYIPDHIEGYDGLLAFLNQDSDLSRLVNQVIRSEIGAWWNEQMKLLSGGPTGSERTRMSLDELNKTMELFQDDIDKARKNLNMAANALAYAHKDATDLARIRNKAPDAKEFAELFEEYWRKGVPRTRAADLAVRPNRVRGDDVLNGVKWNDDGVVVFEEDVYDSLYNGFNALLKRRKDPDAGRLALNLQNAVIDAMEMSDDAALFEGSAAILDRMMREGMLVPVWGGERMSQKDYMRRVALHYVRTHPSVGERMHYEYDRNSRNSPPWSDYVYVNRMLLSMLRDGTANMTHPRYFPKEAWADQMDMGRGRQYGFQEPTRFQTDENGNRTYEGKVLKNDPDTGRLYYEKEGPNSALARAMGKEVQSKKVYVPTRRRGVFRRDLADILVGTSDAFKQYWSEHENDVVPSRDAPHAEPVEAAASEPVETPAPEPPELTALRERQLKRLRERRRREEAEKAQRPQDETPYDPERDRLFPEGTGYDPKYQPGPRLRVPRAATRVDINGWGYLPIDMKNILRGDIRTDAYGNLRAPKQGRYTTDAFLLWAGCEGASVPARKVLDHLMKYFDSELKAMDGGYTLSAELVRGAVIHRANGVREGMRRSGEDPGALKDELRGVLEAMGDRDYRYRPANSDISLSMRELLTVFCDCLTPRPMNDFVRNDRIQWLEKKIERMEEGPEKNDLKRVLDDLKARKR